MEIEVQPPADRILYRSAHADDGDFIRVYADLRRSGHPPPLPDLEDWRPMRTEVCAVRITSEHLIAIREMSAVDDQDRLTLAIAHSSKCRRPKGPTRGLAIPRRSEDGAVQTIVLLIP